MGVAGGLAPREVSRFEVYLVRRLGVLDEHAAQQVLEVLAALFAP